MLQKSDFQIDNTKKNIQTKSGQEKKFIIDPVSPSPPFKSRDSLLDSPLEYVSIRHFEEITRIRVGLYVDNKNYSKHCDKLFEAIASFEKKEGHTTYVDVTGLIDISRWPFLYSKLEENLDLLSRVDAIDLEETDISWLHLEQLYTLYRAFDDKEKFPHLYSDDTPALDELRSYRNFFLELHRPLDFFDKLRVNNDKALDIIDKWEELQRSEEK